MADQQIRINLAPKAGFCVKTKTEQGLKVFVNIAWDSNVPPPPKGNEEAIQAAIEGTSDVDPDTWYVPVVVSEPRKDIDKGQYRRQMLGCLLIDPQLGSPLLCSMPFTTQP